MFAVNPLNTTTKYKLTHSRQIKILLTYTGKLNITYFDYFHKNKNIYSEDTKSLKFKHNSAIS